MEVHACFENCERGLFITLEKDSDRVDLDLNPRIDTAVEEKILNEFKKAKFDLLNDDLSVAKTDNFVFRKYESEKDDKIIWVEPIIQEEMNKVIL
jgi:hypothetical protein